MRQLVRDGEASARRRGVASNQNLPTGRRGQEKTVFGDVFLFRDVDSEDSCNRMYIHRSLACQGMSKRVISRCPAPSLRSDLLGELLSQSPQRRHSVSYSLAH